jgi:NitT/TauT family transport system substrate-binding protein
MPESKLLRRNVLQVLGLAGLAGTGVRPAWAQGSGASVEYGIAGADALHSAAYVASQKGDFDKHGLKVSVINSQSGPRSKQMLAAGQLLAATSGCNDSLALSMAGKHSVLVYGFDKRIGFANLLVHKDSYDSGKIRKVSDLEGQNIAVTQPQSATWLMAVFLADKAGIKDKVQIRGLGDFTTMLGALKSKQVQATIATIGMVDAATAEGWAVPIFQATSDEEWQAVFGGDVPGVGVYVLADTIAKRRADVQAFVDGLVAGQDFLNVSTPEQIAAVVRQEFLSSYAEDAVVKSIRTYQKSLWTKDNLITPESYQRLIGIMTGRQITAEDAAQLPYDKMVDMSFVKSARKMG